MTRPGGRVVLVGIPSDDRLAMKHSTARRKGLTIKLCRRMKHTYPRAIRLVEQGAWISAGWSAIVFLAPRRRGVRAERRLPRPCCQNHHRILNRDIAHARTICPRPCRPLDVNDTQPAITIMLPDED